jgi:hypothetical protein
MIKLFCHCGIFCFDFSNAREKSLLELTIGGDIDSRGFPTFQPRIDFSLRGQAIYDNSYTVNCEGTTGEVLEKNNLTFDIFRRKIVKTPSLGGDMVADSGIALGLLNCNSLLKKYWGVYNLKQNTTEALSYETY